MNVFTVYKTTYLNTGQYYYGFHETDNPQDGYLGSGIWVKRAVKKYGKKNFRKNVLSTHPTDVEAYAKEVELIKLTKNDPLCMNLQEGGRGSFRYINEHGLSNYLKAAYAGGKKASESGQAVKAAATGRQRMIESGLQKEKGRILGAKNVKSGHLAGLRTHEHQVAAGHAAGKKAVESGRIQALGKRYGGNVPKEACVRGGTASGVIAVRTGQLAKARHVVTPAKITHLAKANHLRWHIKHNKVSSECMLCRIALGDLL